MATRTREDEFHSQARNQILVIVAANLSFVAVGLLLYYNFALIHAYIQPLAWALLCSVALHPTKKKIVEFLDAHGGIVRSSDGEILSIDPNRHLSQALVEGPAEILVGSLKSSLQEGAETVLGGVRAALRTPPLLSKRRIHRTAPAPLNSIINAGKPSAEATAPLSPPNANAAGTSVSALASPPPPPVAALSASDPAAAAAAPTPISTAPFAPQGAEPTSAATVRPRRRSSVGAGKRGPVVPPAGEERTEAAAADGTDAALSREEKQANASTAGTETAVAATATDEKAASVKRNRVAAAARRFKTLPVLRKRKSSVATADGQITAGRFGELATEAEEEEKEGQEEATAQDTGVYEEEEEEEEEFEGDYGLAAITASNNGYDDGEEEEEEEEEAPVVTRAGVTAGKRRRVTISRQVSVQPAPAPHKAHRYMSPPPGFATPAPSSSAATEEPLWSPPVTATPATTAHAIAAAVQRSTAAPSAATAAAARKHAAAFRTPMTSLVRPFTPAGPTDRRTTTAGATPHKMKKQLVHSKKKKRRAKMHDRLTAGRAHWKWLWRGYILLFLYHYPGVLVLALGLLSARPLLKRLFAALALVPNTALGKAAAERLPRIDALLCHLPSKIYGAVTRAIGCVFGWFHALVNVLRSKFKRIMLRHVHSLVGTALIIAFVVGTLFASLFLISHCVEESTQAVSNLGTFIDGDMRAWLEEHGVLDIAVSQYHKGKEWIRRTYPNETQLVFELIGLYENYKESASNLTVVGFAGEAAALTPGGVPWGNNKDLFAPLHFLLRSVQEDPFVLYDSTFLKQAGAAWEEISLRMSRRVNQASVQRFLATGSVLLQYMQDTFYFLFQHFSSASVSAANFAVSLSLFFSCLFYLVTSDKDFLSNTMSVMPVNKEAADKISIVLAESVKRVFTVNFQVAAFHACFTWLVLRVSGVHFVYICSVASGVLGLLPFLPSWIVCVPALFELWALGEKLKALCVLLGHWIYLTYFVDTALYNEIPDSHPWMTAWSVIFGMNAFGLEGVLIGPILIILTTLLHKLLSWRAVGKS